MKNIVLPEPPEEKTITSQNVLKDCNLDKLKAAATAEKPDRRALYYLSEYYRTGYDVVPQDFDEALSWFKKLAEACCPKPNSPSFHESLIKDYKQALQNNLEAYIKIGKFYVDSQLGTINEHVFWFTQAAVQGHAEAQFILGVYYLKNEFLNIALGGEGSNKPLGLNYLFKAAQAENTNAQVALLGYYTTKENKDPTKALFWALKCVQHDAKNDQRNIGRCQAYIANRYLSGGEWIEKNFSIALYWYQKAVINLKGVPWNLHNINAVKKLVADRITEATEETAKRSIAKLMLHLPPGLLDQDQKEYKKNVTPELKHERKQNDPGFETKNTLNLPPGHEVSQPTNMSGLEPVPAPSMQSQLMLFQNRLDGWVQNPPIKEDDLRGLVNTQLQEQLAMIQTSIAQLQLKLREAQFPSLSGSAEDKREVSAPTILVAPPTEITPPPVKRSTMKYILTPTPPPILRPTLNPVTLVRKNEFNHC